MNTITVIGPPGTGKTRKIEEIIKQEKPDDFLYLTYNVNMALSARERILDDRHKIGTIHSIMAQKNSLGPFLRFTDQIEFAKLNGMTYPVKQKSNDQSDLERFLRYYDMTINLMRSPQQPMDEKLNMPYLYDRYEEWKAKQGKYDYTDILQIASEGDYVTGTLFLDEAQDLSPLMWKTVDRIRCNNRVIVGDPHQSINGFRGVRVRDFQERIENMEVLNRSYRFGDNVRSLADMILGPARIVKSDYIGMGETVIDRYSLRQFSALQGSKAILCRTNALAAAIARKLPYALVPINKEHSYDNGWTDMTFRIAGIMKKFPNISGEDFRYIVEHSPADLWVRGTKSRVKKEATLFSYDLMKSKMTVQEIVRRMDIDLGYREKILELLVHDVPVIQVDTIHAAKGLEWDHVMLLLDMPKHIAINNEERRLFYVATTRARKSLDFTYFGMYTEMFEIPGHASLMTQFN